MRRAPSSDARVAQTFGESELHVWLSSIQKGDLVGMVAGEVDRGRWGTDIGSFKWLGVVSSYPPLGLRGNIKIAELGPEGVRDEHKISLAGVLSGKEAGGTIVRIRKPMELCNDALNAFISPDPSVPEVEFLHYMSNIEGVSVGAKVRDGAYAVSIDSEDRLRFVARLGITTSSRVQPYGGWLYEHFSKEEMFNDGSEKG